MLSRKCVLWRTVLTFERRRVSDVRPAGVLNGLEGTGYESTSTFQQISPASK